MTFQMRRATQDDLAFVRTLTCQNMLSYYIHYELLWQDEAFDVAWAGRENWLMIGDEAALGFFSLSRDARALYIRELQVAQAFQGQGAGSWAIDQVIAMARRDGNPAVRLTVFKNNMAKNLYLRKGFVVQGEDECFLRMQLDISTSVL
ncbi:GNAT family N-acetyltransferase [Pseudomonas sp. NPDC089741]|uniref:GNAT family N-acetyltransferase n=1 Tax=Pseudomonas sp. NPDC089741 TaxID=3364470 RepID=UPI0037F2A653